MAHLLSIDLAWNLDAFFGGKLAADERRSITPIQSAATGIELDRLRCISFRFVAIQFVAVDQTHLT